MKAVAADRDGPPLGRPPREAGGDPAPVLRDPFAARAEHQGLCAQALAYRFDEHAVHVAAVDGQLRPVVARVSAARLLVHELSEAVVEAHLARRDRAALQPLGQPQLGQLANRVGQ